MESLPSIVVYGGWIWRLSFFGLLAIALLFPWLRARVGIGRRREVAAHESSEGAAAPESDPSDFGFQRARGPIGSRLIPLIVAMLLYSFVFLFGASVLDTASEMVPSPQGGASVEEILEMHRASQLLAATPFGRKKALERIHYHVHLKGFPGPETREALIALPKLQGCCDCAMEAMLGHRQFARTLEYGFGCDEPRARLLAARAALALDRIEEASALLDGYDEGGVPERSDAARVHLLAGEISRAADTAERTAEWLVGDSEELRTDAEALAIRAKSSAQFACLAHALRASGGDPVARAKLDALLGSEATIECLLLAADSRTGEEREAILSGLIEVLGQASDEEDSFRSSWRTSELESLALLLQAEADPVREASLILSAWVKGDFWSLSRYMPRGQINGQADMLVARSLGLERSLLETLNSDDDLPEEANRAKSILAFRAAVDASIILRQDEALRLLTIARESNIPSDIPHIETLAALLEFGRGDLDAVRRILETEIPHSSSSGLPWRSSTARGSVAGKDLWAMAEALAARQLPEMYYSTIISKEALDRALKGNGNLLAAELRTPLYHIHPSILHTLAPLAHWLPPQTISDHLRYGRFGDPFEGSVGTGVPSHLVSLARIGEVIGDEDLGTNLVTAMHSIYDASLRREIAVPLLLLNHF